jgi:hypothetical protein
MNKHVAIAIAVVYVLLTNSSALAQFSAQVFQESGVYSATTAGQGSVSNGGAPASAGGGNIIFSSSPGLPGLGDIVTFSFNALSKANLPGHFGSASISGTAYITWKITGPATGTSYNVKITINMDVTNSADADCPSNGDYCYGHASGPIGQQNAAASGPNADDYPPDNHQVQPLFESVTLDATGVGYVTVPFTAQCESQASGPFAVKRTEGFGSVSTKINVIAVNYP